MDRIRVRMLQVASPDEESMATRVDRVVAQARALGRGTADLVVLPELWATGYFNVERYRDEAEELAGATVGRLREVAADLGAYLVAGSLVERGAAGDLFNTTVLLGPSGDLVAAYRKIHLFGYQSDEARALTAGREIVTAPTDLGVVGLATCYDLRFPELFRALVDAGAHLVVVVSAWPLARLDHWRVLTRARAIENQVHLLACNAAGSQAGREMAGASVAVDPWGVVLAEAGHGPATVAAELDPGQPAAVRAEFPVLTHRRIGPGRQITPTGAEPAGPPPVLLKGGTY